MSHYRKVIDFCYKLNVRSREANSGGLPCGHINDHKLSLDNLKMSQFRIIRNEVRLLWRRDGKIYHQFGMQSVRPY